MLGDLDDSKSHQAFGYCRCFEVEKVKDVKHKMSRGKRDQTWWNSSRVLKEHRQGKYWSGWLGCLMSFSIQLKSQTNGGGEHWFGCTRTMVISRIVTITRVLSFWATLWKLGRRWRRLGLGEMSLFPRTSFDSYQGVQLLKLSILWGDWWKSIGTGSRIWI